MGRNQAFVTVRSELAKKIVTIAKRRKLTIQAALELALGTEQDWQAIVDAGRVTMSATDLRSAGRSAPCLAHPGARCLRPLAWRGIVRCGCRPVPKVAHMHVYLARSRRARKR